jgi:hypothetical protein
MNPLGLSYLSRSFHSSNLRVARYRTELLLGGIVLLFSLLVPGSRVVAQSGAPPDSVLLSIAVTPTDALIFPDRRQQFTATGTYSDGYVGDLTKRVKWTSSVLDVVTISEGGLACTHGEGQTTIQAALGVVDGSTTLTVSRFVWTGSMNTERYWHTATLLNDGMVLVAGGINNYDQYVAIAELYNPATGTFTATGKLNAPRYGHTATLLNNGMVLVAGGNQTSAELYNPATGTFTVTGSPIIARTYASATLLNNGMVLVAGGIGNNNQALASAELYDPATGTFTATGSMNTAGYFQMATLLDSGMVLITGGWADHDAVGSAELYNPSTGSFSDTNGSMTYGPFEGTATLLNNGMVLVAGGGCCFGLPNAELYNPAIGIFIFTGSMNALRDQQTATLLNNGMVLVAGGGDNQVSAELYDPATGTFTLTGSMNTSRTLHTATLLDNGMVLIAGGLVFNIPNGVLTSAELYEPATRTPPDLESIAVTPERSDLSSGETEHFIATGKFRDGSKQQLASVTWTSSNPQVAQISNDATNHGVGLAIEPGTVIITATAGHVRGRARLTVHTNERK